MHGRYATSDGLPFAELIVTLDALHALRTLVPNPLPPMPPHLAASAGAASRGTPPPLPTSAAPPTSNPPPSAPASAHACKSPFVAPAAPSGAPTALATVIDPASYGAPLPPSSLPIRIEMRIASIELAPSVLENLQVRDLPIPPYPVTVEGLPVVFLTLSSLRVHPCR